MKKRGIIPALALLCLLLAGCGASGTETPAAPTPTPAPEDACTVTFDANRGTGRMEAQTVAAGAETALTPNGFTREDFAFSGWNTDAAGGGTAYGDRAKLTVTGDLTLYAQWEPKLPVIRTQPKNAHVIEGETATFRVAAEGAKRYQWYYRPGGTGEWTTVLNNGKAATLEVKTKQRHNGNIYRCAVMNDAGEQYTAEATLTLDLKPVITLQPADVTVKKGETAVFTVAAEGAKRYQWLYRTGSEGEWTEVKNNGTEATYTLVTKARHNGYQYRCAVKNANGTTRSEIVTLTVE